MNMLFVEDDKEVVDNYLEYLNDHFSNVYHAQNGAEGLDVFANRKVDFILADIEMNKMNGLKMIEKIRLIDQKVPIVVLTAYDTKKYLHDAIPLNLTKYLVKPVKYFKFIELISTIKKDLMIDISEKMFLVDNVIWDRDSLYKNSIEIHLTKNELLFFNKFCKKDMKSFSLEDVHNAIYPLEVYNENKIRMLLKRIRSKTSKDIFLNHYSLGFTFNTIN